MHILSIFNFGCTCDESEDAKYHNPDSNSPKLITSRHRKEKPLEKQVISEGKVQDFHPKLSRFQNENKHLDLTKAEIINKN